MKIYRKLSESLVFRCALIIPVSVGIILMGVSAIYNTSSPICWSSACIGYFFELYKYPIAILGMSVPLTAIAASLHRSEEASVQIEEVMRQNVFNNYVKHKDDFFDFLARLEITNNCIFSDPLGVYRKIFPLNSYASFTYFSHQSPEDVAATRLEFLEELRVRVRAIIESLYNRKADDEFLVSLIFDIDSVTCSLGLKQSANTISASGLRSLVWPDSFSRESSKNLLAIWKGLAAFALYTPAKDHGPSSQLSELRAANSGTVKLKNMEAMDRIAGDMEGLL